jgi:hypothetical protein
MTGNARTRPSDAEVLASHLDEASRALAELATQLRRVQPKLSFLAPREDRCTEVFPKCYGRAMGGGCTCPSRASRKPTLIEDLADLAATVRNTEGR